MIHTLDSGYLNRSAFAAVYAVQSQGEWAVIDSATEQTSEKVISSLTQVGAVAEQVRYLIITHVHLDHAGGAAALIERFPNATLLAHPRALRHLADPTKLIQSATRVYGQEQFKRLYGTVQPIDPSRIRTVGEGERVDLGSGQFQIFESPGHARHHISALWEESGALFSGDSLGLAYPWLGGFVCASTSPTDFDPAAALAEVERGRKLGLRALYPTHFGKVALPAEHLDRLERSIRVSERLAREELRRGDTETQGLARLKTLLKQSYAQELRDLGLTWDESQWEGFELDLNLNAQGLLHWVKTQNRNPGEHNGI